MLRKALTAALLVGSLVACSDTPSPDSVSVIDYVEWARARTSELSTLMDELEAHMLAANMQPGIENEQPWRDRAELLINSTVTVAKAVRAWQTVPAEAGAVHQLLLEAADYAETMVVNAGQAISTGDRLYMSSAIDGRTGFQRLEPDLLTALNALEASASGQ